MFFIGTLSQTLTLRAAFASSTYLLPQIHGPGRSSDDDLFTPPFKGARQASVRTRAHGYRFAVLRPASDDALLTLRTVLLRLYSPKKRLPMLDTHDAACKSLIMTALGVFRVGIFATLKTIKQLSLSNLQVTHQKCSARQQGCPREDLPPSVLEGGAREAGGPGPLGGFLLPRVLKQSLYDNISNICNICTISYQQA